MKLDRSFYQRDDVVNISKELLGKILFTRISGKITAGKIVETEAYRGPEDKASHSYGNRRTSRTEVMYHPGGKAYVYLIYGIHHLFNIVTNVADCPHAILIRGVEPVDGLDLMLKRRGMVKPKHNLTAGPGALSKALGINLDHYGVDLTGNTIWLEENGVKIGEQDIVAGSRVGVDYAEEDALLPWRFSVRGNPWVSKAK